MSKTFEEKDGINVKMQRKSSGETFAQIRASQLILRETFGGAVPDPTPAGSRRKADCAVRISDEGRVTGLGHQPS